MIRNIKLAGIFWLVPTAFAFLAALAGVTVKGIYEGLFAPDYLPGALAQDILTIIVCLVLFFLIATTKENDLKKQVIIVGVLGAFFYLYGILTMERVYNWFYLLYLAIFASSFWAIIYTLTGFRSERFPHLRLGKGTRLTTAIVSILIALIFTFLWVMALIPLMRDRNRIEFLYSIYILDLGFVMPAFFISAVMSLRKISFGILITPAIMIMGFFVIFPLGLNELAKPSYGMPMNVGPLAISFLFSFLMLIIGAIHLRQIRMD